MACRYAWRVSTRDGFGRRASFQSARDRLNPAGAIAAVQGEDWEGDKEAQG